MNKEIKKEFYKIYNDETQNIVKDLKLLDFIQEQIDKAIRQERERIIEEIRKSVLISFPAEIEAKEAIEDIIKDIK